MVPSVVAFLRAAMDCDSGNFRTKDLPVIDHGFDAAVIAITNIALEWQIVYNKNVKKSERTNCPAFTIAGYMRTKAKVSEIAIFHRALNSACTEFKQPLIEPTFVVKALWRHSRVLFKAMVATATAKHRTPSPTRAIVDSASSSDSDSDSDDDPEHPYLRAGVANPCPKVKSMATVSSSSSSSASAADPSSSSAFGEFSSSAFGDSDSDDSDVKQNDKCCANSGKVMISHDGIEMKAHCRTSSKNCLNHVRPNKRRKLRTGWG
jgi:hypothetical protein